MTACPLRGDGNSADLIAIMRCSQRYEVKHAGKLTLRDIELPFRGSFVSQTSPDFGFIASVRVGSVQSLVSARR